MSSEWYFSEVQLELKSFSRREYKLLGTLDLLLAQCTTEL